MRTEKPWGYEDLIEKNDRYVVKVLFMKKNHKCSIQYHEKKHETCYVLSGKLKLHVGDSAENLQEIILLPHDFYVLPPGKIHRMEGLEDSLYLESSTTELDDVVRIKDEYGRCNTK